MQIQPAMVLRCSACGNFMYMITRGSGWSWLAVFWTDGMVAAGKSVGDPKLAVCPHCKTLHWTESLEKQGEVHCAEQVWEDGRKTLLCSLPSVKDYRSLLGNGVTGTRERDARVGLMWKYNDQRRRESSKAPGPSTAERENLVALARILDEEAGGALLLKAEIMRELGRFTDARTLLKRSPAGGDPELREAIDRLSRAGDTRVRKIDRHLHHR
ncbi:hypothetical protein L4X63_16475 [Geomonas sp. Red32]|uniref:hypothetical protein n=1 Tax=Geomonas sp. Red32 TaxID=2912856 RepID=UPI00202CBAE9|nr:hypothetical protein [Geomonas sp. Red32]MCM0083182.1 hypothetical protein [Geomonas sp. Red32]